MAHLIRRATGSTARTRTGAIPTARPVALLAAGAALALGLTACSQGAETEPAEATSSAAASESMDKAAAAGDLTFDNAVVRAKGEDNHMTAVFGTLTNHSDRDITIVGFESSLNAPKNQLHETHDGVMQEMTKPLTIPAGQSHEMAAGGDHLMIMDYPDPVKAGDTVDIRFNLADGTAIEVKGLPVRTMLAGDEDYGDLADQHGGEMGMDHEHMDHGHMGH
ncbi:copper chaperone PCu(A)C [Corynebacterium atypicum]|uniref:copper chaperone PCu(A)C n=1 Tax=Corynebacterium atypicum TaxID=191610 RepID=UPI0009FFD9B0|nr:copper chaperone PCu(A)C [Corynebacterium atypicum]